jgi:splicing factor 3B subunit 2
LFQKHAAPIERETWGELDQVEEDEESEEEEEDYNQDEDMDTTEIPIDGFQTAGLATPSGMASIPAGLETPDHIELRKDTRR